MEPINSLTVNDPMEITDAEFLSVFQQSELDTIEAKQKQFDNLTAEFSADQSKVSSFLVNWVAIEQKGEIQQRDPVIKQKSSLWRDNILDACPSGCLD